MSEKILLPDLAGHTLKLFQSFNTKLKSKENYQLWLDDIGAILGAHGTSLDKLQEGNLDTSQSTSFWNVLRLSLSEQLKLEFQTSRTPKTLITAIKNKFAKNPLIEVAYLERQLRLLESDNFTSFENYISALNDTSSKLDMLG
uniref:Fmp27_GFWDK domain-containing protein n=1 Tax=Strongyloides papillosus TaxID=174720 RepID=A0A0N5BE85_STREA